MRFAFLITFLLVVVLFANAQSERLTLPDAVSRSLEHNYDIKVIAVLAQEAGTRNTIGNAGLLPSINGNGGLNLSSANTHMEFADGRLQNVSGAQTLSYNAGVSANYTLFAAGRAWMIRSQLKATDQLAQIQLRQQMQATISQTIQTYSNAVWQQQQRAATDTALALAKARMLLTQMQYETGLSAKVDFLQARVDYNARQSDSLALMNNLNAAFSDLNFLMGADPFNSYQVDDSLTLNTHLTPSDPSRLANSNLSIDIAKRNLELAHLGERISRTNLLPSLGVNVGYNYSHSQSQAGFALFNRSFGPSGGLNLNIPIYQGGTLQTQLKVAGLEAKRQELLLDRQHTDISRQYRTIWKAYQLAVSAYHLEQENIHFAKENLLIQEARFRAGIATTIETREAENSYVQALNRLFSAAYNLKINETKVLELESKLDN
ncbi:MAG: TolC family protein [Bacteroidetes bacterium]|nr:TolC family protein [Bacteroidota bacterium]